MCLLSAWIGLNSSEHPHSPSSWIQEPPFRSDLSNQTSHELSLPSALSLELHLLQPCLPVLLIEMSGWTLKGCWTWFISPPFLGLSVDPTTSTSSACSAQTLLDHVLSVMAQPVHRSPLVHASSPS